MSSFRRAVEWAQQNTPRPTQEDIQAVDRSVNNPVGSVSATPVKSSSPKPQESNWTSIFRSIWFWIIVAVIIIIVIFIVYFVYYREDPDQKVYLDERQSETDQTRVPPITTGITQNTLNSPIKFFDSKLSSGEFKGPIPISSSERFSTPLNDSKPTGGSYNTSNGSKSSYSDPVLINRDGKQYELLELSDGESPPEGFVEVTD